ncbi:glycosyltransferase family 9 protein [Mariniblastus sp.]|nr:glycosyltransferase family 9 protein [Mariniblastus sp.]
MDGSVSKSPTILITRLSHIGDCILTLPMLDQIKQVYPDSKIVWAVESPTQQLLSLVPGIDHIVNVPKSWMTNWKHWLSLRKEFRAHQIDIAIDPQGITKSAALGWISGAKKRIGIRGRWGRELSTWLNNQLVETKSSHVVDRSVELVTGMLDQANQSDFQQPSFTFKLPVCVESQTRIDQWLKQTHADHQIDLDKFVLINPGGSWASKRWEVERYGEVASELRTQFEMSSVVVWAGEEERQMAKQIATNSEGAAVIACSTTLRELAALAKRAKFFLGGDTGPMHIAAAVGTLCVGLYGTTRPEESGAYGDQHESVQKWYQAGTCRERRSAANDAMRDISVADVIQSCQVMQAKLGNSSVAVNKVA